MSRSSRPRSPSAQERTGSASDETMFDGGLALETSNITLVLAAAAALFVVRGGAVDVVVLPLAVAVAAVVDVVILVAAAVEISVSSVGSEQRRALSREEGDSAVARRLRPRADLGVPFPLFKGDEFIALINHAYNHSFNEGEHSHTAENLHYYY